MASTEARQKLINALVKLSKVSSGGYFGLSKSGGRRKRCGSGLSGGGLSGGAKRRPRRRGASLGITNISAAGLSGGRRRVGRPRKAAGAVSAGKRKAPARKRATGGASPWVSFVKKWAKDHNITYGQAMIEAADPYKRRKTRR